MPMPAGLTQLEVAEFLNCRINTIEAVLSAIIPGFNSDLESVFNEEIKDSTIIDAAAKTKLINIMKVIRARHKIDRA